MPSLIDLRRRIRSVKSTQQITKAMKMIASSRLRKAQDRVLASRPMARQVMTVLRSLSARVDHTAHPLLARRGEERPGSTVMLIVVTADKGLCGAFNTNILKEASRFIMARPDRQIVLGLVGRKGRDFFRRRGFTPRFERTGIFQHLEYPDARTIATLATDEYVAGTVDAVYILYNEFKSILQQRIVVEQLLPIEPEEFSREDRGGAAAGPPVDYLYEPSAQEIFDELLPTYVFVEVWQALVESAAAEHAARMTAMDSASRNAGEVIDSLTLYMNKVRQAGITREIIEVVSGAQAL
jgi:F-type H+-transporting ATPase subunit gamma